MDLGGNAGISEVAGARAKDNAKKEGVGGEDGFTEFRGMGGDGQFEILQVSIVEGGDLGFGPFGEKAEKGGNEVEKGRELGAGIVAVTQDHCTIVEV